MKKYTYSTTHRGQPITKMCCAKNVKEAAYLLDTNVYCLSKYGFKNKIENPFEGVVAYFDSGMLWREERSLIRVEMPLDELIKLINKHQDKNYNEFKKKILR